MSRPTLPRLAAQLLVAALFATPAATPLAGQQPRDGHGSRVRPQVPVAPLPYHEEEIVVLNPDDGTALAGTLTLPPGAGPFPAVLLVSGSGTQDRNYGQHPWNHPTFLVLADQLTRSGIAVLRLDDRGIGGSGGERNPPNAQVVGDVLTALEVLRRNPRVDTARVGLIGHSWGGYVSAITAMRHALTAHGHNNVTVEVLSGITHQLQSAAPGGPSPIEDIEETLAPIVVKRIVDWVRQLSADPPALALIGVNVVDVESGTVQRNRAVLIGGDRIISLGPAGETEAPPHARVVDGRGGYLIPGLIETHTHLTWDLDSLRPPEPIGFTARHLLRQLASGVTTVREASSRGLERRQLEVRETPGAFEFPIPRIYVSGRIDPRNVARYGADDARDLARRLIALGVDGLKIRNGLTIDDVRGVVAEARAAGVPVFGHTYAYPREAVEAGIDGVMHVDGLLVLPAGGHPIPAPADTTDWAATWLHAMNGWLHRDVAAGDDILHAMVKRGVWLEPTLLVMDWVAEPEYYRHHPALYRGETYEQLREGFPTPAGAAALEARSAVAEMGAFVARFHELGGVILAGTDSYVLDGMDLHEELRLLVRSGLSPAAALQAATVNAARALAWDDRVGTIRVGQLADLVLLEANPLDDIRNTQRIRGVVHGGRYLDRAALDALLATTAQPAPAPKNREEDR